MEGSVSIQGMGKIDTACRRAAAEGAVAPPYQMLVFGCVHLRIKCISPCQMCACVTFDMGWLRLVGSLKL